jgi:hypothetical protein
LFGSSFEKVSVSIAGADESVVGIDSETGFVANISSVFNCSGEENIGSVDCVCNVSLDG